MAWLQLALITGRDHVPLIEIALENAGALAITLDDPSSSGDAADPADIRLLEPGPGETPLWALVRLTALFEDTDRARDQADRVASLLAESLAAAPRLEFLADQIWERAWLEHWQPLRFGERLWVCPHDQAPADASAIVVTLDPGLAFGTGSHPTTALCLEWLERIDIAGKTIIDYGCGSGILAIAALKLGARHAIAIDHDPQALIATRANADANGVADRLTCQSAQDRVAPPADILIANILAGVLVELAPALLRLCRMEGLIALSGILEPQIPGVMDAYRQGIAFDVPQVRAQWAVISGIRATPGSA